jgi:catechol 2,3-dioxygenase-like lactoylglutathione lyase family enzyme
VAQPTDWTKWEFYHYLIAAGVIVIVLALILYCIPGFRIKMPAIAIAALGSLAAGLGIGMVVMAALGYHLEPRTSVDEPPGAGGTQGKGSEMMKGMGGRGKGGGGMGGMMSGKGKGGGGGGRGPSPKTQLATLVDKLDVLTSKPLAIELTPDKKVKVAELLKGLDNKAELSDEDAKQKLDALLAEVQDQKRTLEAAGFRWPGEGGGGRAGAAPPQASINHASFRMRGFDPDKVMKALADYGIKPREQGARGPAGPLTSYVTMRMPDRGGSPGGTPELYFTDPDGILLQIQDVSYCGGSGAMGEVCVP